MEKNPISQLQEKVVMKYRETPIYKTICEISGTHINSFTIRVECAGNFADGEGPNKKEAKAKAAMKMLEKLNLCKSSQPITKINTNTTTQQSIKIDSPNSSITQFNYIGSLEEYASKRQILKPKYETEMLQEPCQITFIVVCKFQGLTEKAEATSKKKAKLLAAQKMYTRIISAAEKPICVPKIKIDSYLDPVTNSMLQMKIFEQNKNSMEQSIIKAKQLYTEKTETKMTPREIQKVAFKEYHTLLKNSFTFNERKIVINKLQVILVEHNNFNKNNAKIILENALKILKINLKEKYIRAQKNFYIYNLILDTNPTISEMREGLSENEAVMNTIIEMTKTVILLLM